MKRQTVLSRKIARTIARVLSIVMMLAICNIATPLPVSADTIYKSGTITTDETWTSDNVYVIGGGYPSLSIASGATLTIQAGTVVKFDSGGRMSVSGVLDLQGTASNPVVFTSLKDDTYGGDTNEDGIATWPEPGDWGYISFGYTHPDTTNTFEYALVRYGGHYGHNTNLLEAYGDVSLIIDHNTFEHFYANANAIYFSGVSRPGTIADNTITIPGNGTGIHILNSVYITVSNNTVSAQGSGIGILVDNSTAVTVNNNSISNTEYGIKAVGASPVISNDTLTDNGYPFCHSGSAFPTYSGNMVAGNTHQGIAVKGVVSSGTWANVGLPYVIIDSVNVPPTATLTIQAGTVVKLVPNETLGVSGILDLQGTSANPVVFTSYKDDTYGGDTNGDGIATWPQPGDWDWISFGYTHPDTVNTFEYAIIRYGGGDRANQAMLTIGGTEVTVRHALFEHSANNGLNIYRESDDPDVTVQCCTFRDNRGSGLYVYGP